MSTAFLEKRSPRPCSLPPLSSEWSQVRAPKAHGVSHIRAQDPYREAEEVFWRREAAISESEAVSFILSGPSGQLGRNMAHAMAVDHRRMIDEC